MKKILSLALASAMVVAALPVAYAAEGEHDYTNGTTITLNGSGTEAWTVTVPAKMVPGDTGTVKAEGMWAADKFLNVGVPSTVTLTYGAQSMDVAVTGGRFSLIGNSVDPVSKEVEISVADASRLFGTWEGTIVYTVNLIQKGDANADGIITDADRVLIYDEYCYQNASELPVADLDGDGVINTTDVNRMYDLLAGRFVNV